MFDGGSGNAPVNLVGCWEKVARSVQHIRLGGVVGVSRDQWKTIEMSRPPGLSGALLSRVTSDWRGLQTMGTRVPAILGDLKAAVMMSVESRGWRSHGAGRCSIHSMITPRGTVIVGRHQARNCSSSVLFGGEMLLLSRSTHIESKGSRSRIGSEEVVITPCSSVSNKKSPRRHGLKKARFQFQLRSSSVPAPDVHHTHSGLLPGYYNCHSNRYTVAGCSRSSGAND